jgi:bifunctional DNA-binding transcriptional regulator/antitoxin component of YhaV-PrlF toxin-antitoxin module
MLKKYNQSNTRTRRVEGAYLNINYKHGTIAINKGASELIGLNAGDKVEFYQDTESIEDWYIAKTDDEYGFPLRKSGAGLVLNNAKVARAITESAGLEQSASYMISSKVKQNDSQSLFLIVTSSANTTGRKGRKIKETLKSYGS